MAKKKILVFTTQPLVDVRTNLMFSTRVTDDDGNVSYRDEQSITFTMRDSEGRDRPIQGLSYDGYHPDLLSQPVENRPVPTGAVRLSVEEE